MPHLHIATAYDRLLRSLESARYARLLADLQVDESPLQPYSTWAEVVDAILHLRGDSPVIDGVLAALLRHRHRDQERIATILLAGCYPLLYGIFKRRVTWDRDPEAVWQAVLVAACEVFARIDPAQRRVRLRQKIINDTAHRLYEGYCRVWRHAEREITGLAAPHGALVSDEHWDDALLDVLDQRDAEQRQASRLARFRDAGIITSDDYLLVVGTRIYGRRVADQAVDLQLSYQAAKKRRQRAEAAIRRAEQVVSPNSGVEGPLEVEEERP
jgi:hypothetical protein